MSKFSRSWSLFKASVKVLRQGKQLLFFPLYAGLAALLLLISLVVTPLINAAQLPNLLLVLLGLLFYFSLFFVNFFFNSALTGAALIHLDGGDPTIADGLSIARSKLGNIFYYALIASTLGMLLQLIGVVMALIGKALQFADETGGYFSEWIARLLGFAYMSATFLVVPILVSQDVGSFAALKESATLLRKTWGENVIGLYGMDAIFVPLYLLLLMSLVIVTAGSSSGISMFVFWGMIAIGFIMLSVISTTLHVVYAAALYRYATTGDAGTNYSDTHLQNAFKK